MIKLALLLISFIYLYSCSGTSDPGQQQEYEKPASKEQGVASDTLLMKWRQDSLGCLHIRTYKEANLIVSKYNLKFKSVREIITLLGNPNKRLKYKDNGIILRYYYDTCCTNGELNEECDFSWWDFIFEESSAKTNRIGGGKM